MSKLKVLLPAILIIMASVNNVHAGCSGEIAKLLGCPPVVEIIDEKVGPIFSTPPIRTRESARYGSYCRTNYGDYGPYRRKPVGSKCRNDYGDRGYVVE